MRSSAQIDSVLRERIRDHQIGPAPVRKRGAVCVAEGFPVQVDVARSQLRVRDGYGTERRERTYSRADRDLARLVILGAAGSISLRALQWLSDMGVGFLALDNNGRTLANSAPGTSDARLRRAQALAAAATNHVGIEISRYLLGAKADAERVVLSKLNPAPRLRYALDASAGELA